MVTLGEIADFLGAEFKGDRDEVITAVRPLDQAGAGELTFLGSDKFAGQLDRSAASAILVPTRQEGDSDRWIRTANPYFALSQVLTRFFLSIPHPESISDNADVASTAVLGEKVGIGAFAVIGERTEIGKRVVIHPGVVIGADCQIGDDSVIYPNVVIYHGTKIGQRCVVHGNVVIGGDGFGFVTEDGQHFKMPQVGTVRIGDDVEIGAGSTIDRAALGETVIGKGTKIDNLVMIGHNNVIGQHCLVVAQVGIAGSSRIGDYVVLAGQAGVGGHVSIAKGVSVAAQSAVMKSIDEAGVVAGNPARPLREHMKALALVQRLPKLLDRIEQLERRLAILEGDPKEKSR